MAPRTEERLSAIILAAGAGARMGGPKALLVVEGELLARLHARRFREAGCARVVIVTRPELVARFTDDAIVVASSAPDPAGSLAIGLRALGTVSAEGSEGDERIAITPVDAWPARVDTLARLASAVHGEVDAATPLFAARGGHPVVVRARVLRGLMEAPRPLREVLAALGSRRARIEVEDAGVAVDLDAPEDVVRATGGPPRFG